MSKSIFLLCARLIQIKPLIKNKSAQSTSMPIIKLLHDTEINKVKQNSFRRQKSTHLCRMFTKEYFQVVEFYISSYNFPIFSFFGGCFS